MLQRCLSQEIAGTADGIGGGSISGRDGEWRLTESFTDPFSLQSEGLDGEDS